MSCLSLLVLVGRGLVDVDAPVENYWPEFGQNGKRNVLVRHLLSHTAGLPAWDQRIEPTDLYDWDKVTEPARRSRRRGGSRARSPATTASRQGNLVGEVVRRVDGRSVGRFFAEEIAGPLGADFHIGLGPEHDSRVALVIPAPPLRSAAATARVRRTATPSRTAPPTRASPPSSRGRSRGDAPRSRPPAATATPAAWRSRRRRCRTAARSAASTLLSEQTIDRIFDVQAAGRDLVLGIGVTFGVGYGLNSPRDPISPNARVCYWGGWGGSLVVNDVDAGFTMAYVMNRMGEGTVGDDRAHTILRAVYASLG